MQTLPIFDASDADSDAFRDFMRRFTRKSAMVAWDREKTFLRGGEKIAEEKVSRWLGALARGGANLAKRMTGPGGQSVAHGLAQAPVRALERGAHMGKTLGQNIAAGWRGAPATGKYFPGTSSISRMPGSPWARTGTGLAIAGGAAAGVGGAKMLSGPGAPQEQPITHNPDGAPVPTQKLTVAQKPVPPAAAKPAATAAPVPQGQPQQPVGGAGAHVTAQEPQMRAQAETAARAAQPAPGAPQKPKPIASAQKVKVPPAMPQGWSIADKTRLFKTGPKKHMSATFGGKQFGVDPRTGAMLTADAGADASFMDKTQGLYKTSAEAKDILKWLLGSALIGAGARTSVSLYHNIAGRDPLSPGEHLYDPEIEIPVDVTPEQMAKYKALRSPKAKKVAAAWDNTLAALTMTGGGALGWSLAHAVIRRAKERALDNRLKKLRGELARLSQPEIRAEGLTDDAIKQAAAEDFFHIAAERYQRHVKEAGPAQKVLDLLAKAKGSAVGTWQGMDPMTKVLAGGGAGLAAAPLIPGVRHIAKGVGDTATGGALAGLKTVGRPIGYGAAATLGPVAALAALYALYKGYESAEKDDPQAAELKALREAVREREIEERPYFKLTPRVLKEQSHAA